MKQKLKYIKNINIVIFLYHMYQTVPPIKTEVEDMSKNEKVENEIKRHRKDEIMQLYDSLDERKQRLILVHIRALAGKN